MFYGETLQRYKNLSLSLSRVRFTIPIDVFADFDVGHLSSLDGNGSVAQGTYWDLDILQEDTTKGDLTNTGLQILEVFS